MKQIKTLSNSFALIETDGNGKVLTQFGFRKGGLSYFIRNNNVKFYLTEDFFYKNVVWSADAPLMIDGIPYDIDALPDALKKIFILEDEGGGGGITVDQTLSTASTNPIGNQAVAHAVNDLDEAVSDRYTKTETDSLLDNKLDVTAYTPTDLSQYWTSGETQSAITQSLSGYATEQWVENQGYLTEHQSLSGYATTADTTDISNTLTAHTADTSVHVTSQEKTYWNNKLDASAYTPTDLSNYYTKGQTDGLLDTKLDVTAYTPTDLSNYYTKSETDGVVDEAVSGKADTSAVTESINAAVSGKADTTTVNQIAAQATSAITALTQTVSNNYDELTGQTSNLDANKFGAVKYYSNTHTISFYAHDATETPLSSIDATDFIKDGMVSNVEISNGNLVITFNSDAGKQPISIPLTDIFNPANYYTTGQTDALLAAKADTATTYTKTEVDTALGNKADTSAVTAVANDVQTVSGQVATKVATSDFNTYTAATATALNGKVDTSALNDYYTKTEVYNKQEVDAAYGTAYQALTAHTADTTVHVTSAEKTTWNNKSDFSGDYNDLTNKPTIPTVPTNISDFTNDAGYITSADIDGKADTSAVTAVSDALTAHTSDTGIHVTQAEKTSWNTKAEPYSAGTGIEISGNVISVTGGSSVTVDPTLDSGSTNPVANSAITTAIDATKVYYIDFVQLTTQGIHDSDWDGMVAAINAHRPIYAGMGERYYTAECLYQNGGNSITMTASDELNHYFYTFTKNSSENYTFTYETRPYTTAAEKALWNTVSGKADTSAVTQVNDALTGHTADTTVHVTSAEKAAWDDKAEVIELTQTQYDALVTKDPDVLYVITDAAPAEVIITTSITSSSTNGQVPSAKAVFDFVGGLKMVKMTSVEYQALATKDDNTVYFVGDSTNGYTMKLGEANIN